MTWGLPQAPRCRIEFGVERAETPSFPLVREEAEAEQVGDAEQGQRRGVEIAAAPFASVFVSRPSAVRAVPPPGALGLTMPQPGEKAA